MQSFQVRIKINFSSEVLICNLELKLIEQTAGAFITLVRGNTTSLLPSIAIVLVSSILLFRQTSKVRTGYNSGFVLMCVPYTDQHLWFIVFLWCSAHQCPQFWSAQETPCQTPAPSCCSTDLQTFWDLQVSKKIFYWNLFPQSLFSTSAVLKAAGSNPHWSPDPQYWTAPRRKLGQESKVSWLKQKQQNRNKHWWSVEEGGLQVTQLNGERSTATTRLLPQPQVATTTRASSRELLNRTDGNSHTAVHHVSAHIVNQKLCLKLAIQILVYNIQTNRHIHRAPHFAWNCSLFLSITFLLKSIQGRDIQED